MRGEDIVLAFKHGGGVLWRLGAECARRPDAAGGYSAMLLSEVAWRMLI